MPARFEPKTAAGRFLEGFRLEQTIRHATPHSLTSGDASLYSALTGARFAPQNADTFARAIGYPAIPIDNLPAFHVAFGKTVAEVSLNAVANFGYAWTHVPYLPEAVSVAELGAACPPIDRAAFDEEPSGSPRWFEDYRTGERVNPAHGVTVEEQSTRRGPGFAKIRRKCISSS